MMHEKNRVTRRHADGIQPPMLLCTRSYSLFQGPLGAGTPQNPGRVETVLSARSAGSEFFVVGGIEYVLQDRGTDDFFEHRGRL